MNKTSSVDVIIPLRNELARIPSVIAMIEAQTLSPVRVVIADGMSTDGSRAALAAAARTRPWLIVVDNPERVVPAALNVALAEVRSPLVARMDTHAHYEATYLATVVRALEEHPGVVGVGGAMDTQGRLPWGRAIASTLRRPFGLGGARHRVGGAAGPISHVFSGCYRAEALRAVGGWDQRFHANEDFEVDTRLRKVGGELWLIPEARSTWFVRETVPRLAVQMWRYGFYKALTLRLHPDSMKPRQLAPPALVAGILVGSLVQPRVTAVVTGIYGLVTATAGALAAGADGASPVRGAAVPAVVHLSWGAGLLAGLPAAVLDRKPRAISKGTHSA